MPEYSKNQLLRHDDRIIRVLTFDVDVLIIDCLKRTMPQWMPTEELQDWVLCDETALPLPEAHICNIEELTPAQRKVMHERYTLIAPILPFIYNEAERSSMVSRMAELNQLSKQTIRKYLCLYLTYQRMEVLAPPLQYKQRELTTDEKTFRWALNKFYYTQRKHSLPTAYNLMLKEKYTDAAGQLFGTWIIDRENDGTMEHPIQMPYVRYTEMVDHFVHDVYAFMEANEDFELNRYGEILQQNGWEWGSQSMSEADVSDKDARCVMALIMGAVRAERFCDGALLRFFREGCIRKWLERLQEIDNDSNEVK